MNDLPSTMLLQQVNARPVSGEDLEVFGKEAAIKYTRGDCGTLSEAVVETVKSAGLSPEQVRRVVELANTDAFLQAFRKEGQHKVVEFAGGPANYSDILKDLNDGGGGTVLDKGNNDYELPPPDVQKTATRNQERLGLEETKLAEAFNVDERPIPYADPFQDAMDMRDKLAAAYDGVSDVINSLEVHYLGTTDHLYEHVKQAALDGTALGQVVSAWSTVNTEPAFIKAAFEQMTPRLLRGQVFASKGAIGESLTKTASAGMVNPKHPLVETYGEFCETLTKLAKVRRTQESLVQSLDQITTFLKAAARGGLAGKVWKGMGEAVGKAAPHVEKGVGKVVGERAGAVAGKATRKAHWLVPALGGEQVYREAKTGRGPIGGPTRFVKGRIPGTRAAMARQYRLAGM